jgi:hypothetical protein
MIGAQHQQLVWNAPIMARRSRARCGVGRHLAGAGLIVLSIALPVSGQQQTITIAPAPTGLTNAPVELQKALDESALPQSTPDLLTELAKRAADIQETIASGAFGQVWVPAMATKTVALVIGRRTSTLSDAPRKTAEAAIKQIVIAAWDLDTYGDLGDKTQIDRANARLAAGVSTLKAVYAAR